LNLPAAIHTHLTRDWTGEDVLLERLRLGRGRAISGQARGRSLEKEIAAGLLNLNQQQRISFDKGTTYTGYLGRTAKCDFAIPSKSNPKIVIKAKGFEATGSKQTDVLGDVHKIIEARAPHTYFFMVTDGRGWHRRTSDLQKLVEFHQQGNIDMVYTRSRLNEMYEDIRQILLNE
jgi:hypothetical protein